jgi:hypothetical protein
MRSFLGILFCVFTIFSSMFLCASVPFENKISENSLLQHARAVHSQYGEEGIIDAILSKLGIEKGFLVEFGGYDGVSMSNTRCLADRGWKGAFIETDSQLFEQMKRNLNHLPNILCIQEFITPFDDDKKGKTMDAIADQYFPDQEIDIMSIDIDGLDHLVLKTLKRKPKLILIEGGMFWHPMMRLTVPDEIACRNVQQPIIVMTEIANAQGYELICSTFNAFFIRRDLYHHFTDINNDPSLIWWEALLHIKKIHPNFYFEIFQIRQTPWIVEWESKDLNITFSISSDGINRLSSSEEETKNDLQITDENPLASSTRNPFSIEFPKKENLTSHDFMEVQKQIRQVDVKSFVQRLYEDLEPSEYKTFDDFLKRCSKGVWQNLIDPNKNLYPVKELVKMGDGKNRCIVCCGSYNGKYPYYIQSLIQGLRDQNFNGYFLYFIGGWPNPTGEEIKHTAVPYCFKIFTMLEAYKLGFNHVLWIDAACYPLREMEPLFEIIERDGALLNWFNSPSDSKGYIFPQTRSLLMQLTGVDVLNAKFINSIVMGLKMDTPEAGDFVNAYYQFVRMGTPFFSCFPEEFVFTAIINQSRFQNWTRNHPPYLIRGSIENKDDSLEEFEKARQTGVYFYHRKGR